MKLLNLFFPIEDIERLGKFETEKISFNNKRGSLTKQIDSLSTLANTMCACQTQSWSTQMNLSEI